MRILNSAVVLLLAAGLPAGALASAPGPAEAAPAANKLKPDPKLLKKKPIKRRAVRQVVEGVPRIAPPPTEAYGPTLYPSARGNAVTGTLPQPMLPSPLATVQPPSPVQVNSCIGNVCNDTSGTRYTGGVGNTVLDPQGRNCTRTGTTIQCF
ncbi:hypothetical protein [Massilia cavernae]|nr:hypothetical protein [Massilia cavernae]